MRTYDLAPLYRSTVGFDRLFSMLDGFEAAPGYPPYNIETTGENAYRISIAIAGFTDNDLSIEVKENALAVRGELAHLPHQESQGEFRDAQPARPPEHPGQDVAEAPVGQRLRALLRDPLKFGPTWQMLFMNFTTSGIGTASTMLRA